MQWYIRGTEEEEMEYEQVSNVLVGVCGACDTLILVESSSTVNSSEVTFAYFRGSIVRD